MEKWQISGENAYMSGIWDRKIALHSHVVGVLSMSAHMVAGNDMDCGFTVVSACLNGRNIELTLREPSLTI